MTRLYVSPHALSSDPQGNSFFQNSLSLVLDLLSVNEVTPAGGST